jgi:hypothetical protein
MRKSEKRAIGEAKQAINRQASIDSGLRAQKRDRERRQKKAQQERLVESAKKVTKAMQGMSEASKKTTKVLDDANAVLANHGG